jgi:hypothetical protein
MADGRQQLHDQSENENVAVAHGNNVKEHRKIG